ncbi:---NA--- [Octopus vulgaris]|uniref:---NA n=1 Tax=Octopus vulgaris TaxID=6645 RepID=A0AA36AT69_OCTVU|nr:---NA--- [Octopus vulgaris]
MINYPLKPVTLLSIHTKEIPCHCDICGKSFCGKVTLQSIYTREKTYHCDTCDKSFSEICSFVKINIFIQERYHTTMISMCKSLTDDLYGKSFSQKYQLHMYLFS